MALVDGPFSGAGATVFSDTGGTSPDEIAAIVNADAADRQALAETWIRDHYPGITANKPASDPFINAQIAAHAAQIVSEIDQNRNTTEAQMSVLFGASDITDEQLTFDSIGSTYSATSRAALEAKSDQIVGGYTEANADLEICLNGIPAQKENARLKLDDLLAAANTVFGTNFGNTTSQAFPKMIHGPRGVTYGHLHIAANGPYPEQIMGNLSISDDASAHAQWLAGSTPGQTQAARSAAMFAAAASVPMPYFTDLNDTDAAALPYPNYPVYANGTYNINKAYQLLRQDNFTAASRTSTPTVLEPTVYPAGWATAIASGLSNMQRVLVVLNSTPSYEDYAASDDTSAHENLVYGIAPLISTVGRGNTEDIGFAANNDASNTDWHAGSSSPLDVTHRDLSIHHPSPTFYGIAKPADVIGSENLAVAVEQFRAIDSDFAEKLSRFAESYLDLARLISDAIACQIRAFTKDRDLDKQTEAILATVAGVPPATPIGEAARQVRAHQIAELAGELEQQNLANTVADIEFTTDKRNILFKEQCFLLNYINVFIKQKIKEDGTLGKKRLPYVASVARTVPSPTPAQSANNASLLVSGDAYGFLNKLTLNPKLKHLVNIENSELSLLQPSIRLYKVVYDEFGDDDYQVEMKFDSHFTANDLTNFGADAGARGVGAGIKSFVFSYEGSNPFAIKKSIKANLKIFGSSFREFVRERGSSAIRLDNGDRLSGGRKYKYVDLALKTGRADHPRSPVSDGECGDAIDINEQNENLADLNFRLRAEVGWAVTSENQPLISAELRAAIQSSYVTLNLTPTVHNFDFDDTGQVVMNINYLAYIEEFFDNKNFNIFANADAAGAAVSLVTLERLKRTMALKEIARKCNNDSNIVAQVKEDFKTKIVNDQRTALEHLIKSLMEEKAIHYITMPYDDLKLYLLSNDPVATAAVEALVNDPAARQTAQSELNTSIARGLAEFNTQAGTPSTDPGADQPANDAIAAALLATPQEGETVAYFYLGRLVDLILKNIDIELQKLIAPAGIPSITSFPLPALQASGAGPIPISAKIRDQKLKEFQIAKDNFKRLRIVLGPVEFVNSPSRTTSQVTNATFGDIPISVKYFIEYMTDKMLKKEDTFYSLTKFLNDIMNEFVRDFLNSRECFRNVKTKVRAQQASLTSWSPSSDYDVLELKIAQLGLPAGVSLLSKDPSNGKTTVNVGELSAAANRRSTVKRIQDMSPRHPILYLSGPPGARTRISPDQEFNYFVYFAGQIQPLDKMKGKRGEDEARGIFHYMLGRDKGLIKNISLSKTQTRGLAEVRFEQDGYDGLRQLRVVYDVEIDSYANINTYPGTYIFVDPTGFDPGYNIDKISMTELGIGGYYMIIRSEHEFGAGKANTKITAKWVNQVEAEGSAAACQSLRDQNAGSNDISSQCDSYATERENAAEASDGGRNIISRGVDFITPWDGWIPWI